MKKAEFQDLVDEKGFDVAIVEYYWELSERKDFASFLDMKDIAIKAIEDNNLNLALDILNVINNPPEGDSGFYYYDYYSKGTTHQLEPLTNISEVEALIGFEE